VAQVLKEQADLKVMASKTWSVATYARVRPSRPEEDVAEYNLVDLETGTAGPLRGLQVCIPREKCKSGVERNRAESYDFQFTEVRAVNRCARRAFLSPHRCAGPPLARPRPESPVPSRGRCSPRTRSRTISSRPWPPAS
jgi:hypothetical protein